MFDLRIYLHNTDGKGTEKYNILDTIKYEDCENQERELTIDYYHRNIININNMYFVYNDNYFDVIISETDYDIVNPPVNEECIVDFFPIGEAYLVKAERIGTKTFDNNTYYESYDNESGITIQYYERDVDKVLMYYDYDYDMYEHLHVYESLGCTMKYCSDIEDLRYAAMILNPEGSSEAVFDYSD